MSSAASITDDQLNPEALKQHYTGFLRPNRILLTGHSHQALPDVAKAGLLASFEDPAAHVDDKWRLAAEAADLVRKAVADRIGGLPETIALAESTHQLVFGFLSALDWRTRSHIVTTTGEFHSIERQLLRLAELGVSITAVPTDPVETLAARVASKVGPKTAAVLMSTVLFETSAIVPGLPEAVRAAHRAGAYILLDAYHAFGVVPFDLHSLGPDPVYVVGGGCKYAQWGEGVCWMRVPDGCALRPVYTGWFADFESLEHPHFGGRLGYGPTPASRFAGGTYDPASHYRACAVIRFFEEQSLTLPRLRALSQRQTGRLAEGIAATGAGLVLASPAEAAHRGGFVSFQLGDARAALGLVSRLRERGVHVDARGPLVRFGPAPYTGDAEIDQAVLAVDRVMLGR